MPTLTDSDRVSGPAELVSININDVGLLPVNRRTTANKRP